MHCTTIGIASISVTSTHGTCEYHVMLSGDCVGDVW
jgi:hypothetical protein